MPRLTGAVAAVGGGATPLFRSLRALEFFEGRVCRLCVCASHAILDLVTRAYLVYLYFVHPSAFALPPISAVRTEPNATRNDQVLPGFILAAGRARRH